MSHFELIDVRKEHGPAMRAVVAAAFGQPDEAELVERLRANGDVALEIAAVMDGAIIGHILFSELSVEPPTRRVAALAPLSVAPAVQRQGIGSALVRVALPRCAALGFDAVALLGDTEYYARFGFRVETAGPLISVYSGDHYQALELRPGALADGRWRVIYPKAFG